MSQWTGILAASFTGVEDGEKIEQQDRISVTGLCDYGAWQAGDGGSQDGGECAPHPGRPQRTEMGAGCGSKPVQRDRR